MLASLCALTCVAAQAASPLDALITVRVERQPLDEALRALAKQANLQILFDAALVTGRVAQVVRARTSARRVLKRWLSGTNLIAEEQAPGVIVVRQVAGRAEPASTRK